MRPRVFRRRRELCFPSIESISQSVARIPIHARKQNERAPRRKRHPRGLANGACIRFCTTKCGRIKASTDAELALLPPAYLTLCRVEPTQQTLSRTVLILITLLPPSYSNDFLYTTQSV